MRYRQPAYTLVEILVVIAIIGILLSLTMTAIGPTLQAMHKAECQNNLRQLALAAVALDGAKGHLPGYCQKYGQFAGGIDPSDPGNFGGNVPPHVKVGSWHIELLSRLDNQPIYEHWTEDRYPLLSDSSGLYPASFEGYSSLASPNLSIFRCASDSGSIATRGRNNYVANAGMHTDTLPFSYTRPGSPPVSVSFVRSMDRRNGLFNNQYAGYLASNPSSRVAVGRPISLDDCKDGKSNTMLFSESKQAQPFHLTSLSGNAAHLLAFQTVGNEMISPYQVESRYLQSAVWHFEDPQNFAGAPLPAPEHHIGGGDVYNLLMDTTNFTDLARPSSLHYDGVNMAMADGSIRFVADSIDYRLYQALLTPAGKSSDVPMNEFIPPNEF